MSGTSPSRCTTPQWCRSSLLLCRTWWTQLDVLKILGIQFLVLPEQVIEVPTISMLSRCSRTVLSAPQMAEQLVEVPTVLSHALKRTHTHTLAEIHGQTQTNRHTKQIYTPERTQASTPYTDGREPPTRKGKKRGGEGGRPQLVRYQQRGKEKEQGKEEVGTGPPALFAN